VLRKKKDFYWILINKTHSIITCTLRIETFQWSVLVFIQWWTLFKWSIFYWRKSPWLKFCSHVQEVIHHKISIFYFLYPKFYFHIFPLRLYLYDFIALKSFSWNSCWPYKLFCNQDSENWLWLIGACASRHNVGPRLEPLYKIVPWYWWFQGDFAFY